MEKETIDFLTQYWWCILLGIIVLGSIAKGDTEVVKEYYDGGLFKRKIKSITPYKDGVIHGTTIEYHKNGKIKSKFNYHKGIPCGRCEIYHENGNIAEITEEILGEKPYNGFVR